MKIRDFDKLLKEAASEKINSEIKKGSSEKYVVKTQDGIPLESFDNKEDADKFKSDKEKDNPKQKLLIDKFNSYDDMLEELEEINDKLEKNETIDMKKNIKKDSNFMKNESVIMLAKLASKTTKRASNQLINLVESSNGGKINLDDVLTVLNQNKLYDLKKKITLKEDDDSYMRPSDEGDEMFDFEKHGEMMSDEGPDDDDDDEPSYMKKPSKKSKFFDDDPDPSEFEDVRSLDLPDYNPDDDDDDFNFDDLREIGMPEDMDEELYELEIDEDDYNMEGDMMEMGDEYMGFGHENPEMMGMEGDMTEMGDDYNMEGEMYEGKGMCSECGSMLNEEGMCTECMKETYHMNESRKKKVTLKESDLVKLIKKMVVESVPGLSVTEKNRKTSGKESKSYMKDVESKMKKSRKFDGNDNPKFPKQIGKGEKVARQNTTEEDKIMSTYRGGGLEDLKYDTQPSKSFEERMKKALKGDSTMGNSQDSPNVIKSETGENMLKKSKLKKDAQEKDFNVSWGHSWKEPEKVKMVKESKDKPSNVLNEELNRMKQIASYNKKTQ